MLLTPFRAAIRGPSGDASPRTCRPPPSKQWSHNGREARSYRSALSSQFDHAAPRFSRVEQHRDVRIEHQGGFRVRPHPFAAGDVQPSGRRVAEGGPHDIGMPPVDRGGEVRTHVRGRDPDPPAIPRQPPAQPQSADAGHQKHDATDRGDAAEDPADQVPRRRQEHRTGDRGAQPGDGQDRTGDRGDRALAHPASQLKDVPGGFRRPTGEASGDTSIGGSIPGARLHWPIARKAVGRANASLPFGQRAPRAGARRASPMSTTTATTLSTHASLSRPPRPWSRKCEMACTTIPTAPPSRATNRASVHTSAASRAAPIPSWKAPRSWNRCRLYGGKVAMVS